MKRFVVVLGALLATGAVAVPAGFAVEGVTTGEPTTPKPVVPCLRTAFAGTIARVGADALLVKPGQSETGRQLLVRLTDGTVVRQAEVTVDRSLLVSGAQARFLVRVCRDGERRGIWARVIVLVADSPTAPGATPPASEPNHEPAPTGDTCGQGETNAVLASLTSFSITLRTISSEGTKEWPVTVNGDTIVRKNDKTVSLGDLNLGDVVHVVLVRCKSGSARALRIVFVRPPETAV